jgi:DNA-binding transcriptional MocR family regulator
VRGAANADFRGADEASDGYRLGHELVAEQLLNYIAEQNLLPGDRLPTEQGLAEILGATRNVILRRSRSWLRSAGAHIDSTRHQFERKIRDRLFNLAVGTRDPLAAGERASK